MKKVYTFLLLVSASVAGFAQTNSDDYYGSPAKPKLLSRDRVSASISAGTGVSFLSGSKTTGVTTFIAPQLNYQLTNKFRLNFGMMHYTMTPNTAFFMNRNEGLFNFSNRNLSGNLVYVGGDYKLNPRLILSGAVMTDVNSLSKQPKDNYKAASIGMEYKVSEHSSIGFKATISQGQQTYYNNTGTPSAANNIFTPMYGSGFSGFSSEFGSGFIH
ncbi:MAG: hypothetical protein JWP12_3819 [Bacteroidetes bacterium]|nr:hypothetical protein [Bacteroidota bacterium]